MEGMAEWARERERERRSESWMGSGKAKKAVRGRTRKWPFSHNSHTHTHSVRPINERWQTWWVEIALHFEYWIFNFCSHDFSSKQQDKKNVKYYESMRSGRAHAIQQNFSSNNRFTSASYKYCLALFRDGVCCCCYCCCRSSLLLFQFDVCVCVCG